MDFGDDISSNSTVRNWEKLNKSVEKGYILAKRANKRMSIRKIFPKEYVSVPVNLYIFETVLKSIIEKDDINCIIFSFCVNYLKHFNMVKIVGNTVIPNDEKTSRFLEEYKIVIDFDLVEMELPYSEKDPIGMIYQCLMTEGEKNIQGSYFTPETIVKDFTSIEHKDVTILDPCCGTAGILIAIENVKPENLYGIEKDELTAMIAKCNMIIRFRDCDFYPKIVCSDFISKKHTFHEKFDYIITNPPWGAKLKKSDLAKQRVIKSEESFSICIVNAFGLLKKGGTMRFVLPEAILNIRRHSDIRKFILDNLFVEKIKFYGKCFSGVFSDVIGIYLKKETAQNKNVIIDKNGESHLLNQNVFEKFSDFLFICCTQKDIDLLESIYSVPYKTLKGSVWGLGIVTGDNQKKLSEVKKKSYESIFTGKEVEKYFMKEPKYFILFDKETFQQSAPESVYRSEKKLIYRFIANKLVFAIDTSGTLVLNSANVLIPKIINMNIYSIMAFLNSEIFEYINKVWFNQIKVLKSNLLKLPFPLISDDINEELSNLISQVYYDKTAHDRIQQIIYKTFRLDNASVQHIKKTIADKS